MCKKRFCRARGGSAGLEIVLFKIIKKNRCPTERYFYALTYAAGERRRDGRAADESTRKGWKRDANDNNYCKNKKILKYADLAPGRIRETRARSLRGASDDCL